MKTLKQGLCLALLGASLSAVPALQTAAVGAPAADEPLVQQMRTEADGQVRVSTERATGKVSFVRSTNGSDLMPSTGARTQDAAVDKASAYLDKYAAAFGADRDQLVQERVSRDRLGTVVTYTQEINGVSVFGSGLRAHLDEQGDLTAVNGELVPVKSVDTDAELSAEEAGERAVGLVEAQPPTDSDGRPDTAGIRAKSSELVLYKRGLVQGLPGGDTSLVYLVEVSNDANVRDMVFVDADTGKVVNRYSMIHDALDRELYEESPDTEPVWTEGDPFPGDLNQDQQNLVTSTGESYWLFQNTFGRDSYDGEGATMKTVNNDPRISCPNANWNGVTTNYCDGVTSDDVVSHEWGHAYTEFTHGLIYQWQSGALNEAYSDVFGETLDLINGREDEDEGDINAPRPDGLCSKYTRGAIGATINAPEEIAGPCQGAAAASFGPVFDKTGVTTDVVVGTDAANDEGPTTTDGCSTLDNAAAIAGKFVYVDRGTCPFTQKIANAEAAGATGIMVGDNAPARPPISIAGVSDIYGLMVTQADGTKIKSVPGPVNMTIKDVEVEEKADSYRWLMGEKSDAFGGAIRDMWNPTCYGDPGKVSDAEYICGSEDSGGVHSNSGVINHGYSFLVDGGSFNGQTIDGIGITKALAIYYRAMTEYQTEISNFVDHADALEASCTDLVDATLKEPSTEPNDSVDSTEKIAAADCAQVTSMIDAMELRVDPTEQCNWTQMLTPGVEAGCGEGTTTETFFNEDFEGGLDGWTQTEESVYGGPTFDWETTSEYPIEEPEGDGHTSEVAFGPAPDEGACSESTDDISGANYITSGDIEVPADAQAPRMSFDHYVVTEVGFDGGNAQLSVDGGEFAAIPAAAYVENAPDKLASEAEGSTNPLAGQDGFTGTNPGHAFGSWGTSVVDLSAAGVTPGSTVQLRFAIGRDGCGAGIDGSGWYVDNVQLDSCVAVPPAGPEATDTEAVKYQPKPVPVGRSFKVRVKVTADEGTPTGRVEIKKGGKVVGKAKLDDGAAWVTVTKRFPPGKVDLVAKYLGSNKFKPSNDRFTVKVVKKRR
ncbi:MAG TPA: M4 family metallopeptidase [Nocardioides sp.]|nr:M4 family metallopeptidase [Nocardioides sp.]